MPERTDTQRVTDESPASEEARRHRPQLFLVLDRSNPLAGGARHSLVNIDRVVLGRGKARRALRVVEDERRVLRLELPDQGMSATHARIDLAGEVWTVRDDASTNGVRVNGASVREAVLADGDFVETGHSIFRFRSALATAFNAPGDAESSKLRGLAAAFGTTVPALTRDLDSLARVARSPMSILLEGETGTGKEVLARAMHAESKRAGQFVAVNCGALPSGLVESLLFGHTKGAFSGAARDEPGLVRAADGGTLFLDEIGDLPPESQAALLRVLQEKEVVPLGATRPVPVDVRTIAATHRSLAGLVASGAFREDLLARVAQFTHRLPPLRERIEDLGALVAAILAKVAGERAAALSLSARAARELVTHTWPTNVRELERRLQVSVVLAEDDRLDFKIAPTGESAAPPPATPRVLSAEETRLHEELVLRLTEHRGNLTQVAQAMGKARRQVQRWVTRLEIDVDRFRS